MDQWKYLILEFPVTGETAVLFPPHLGHDDMARAFPGATPLSAGFVRFNVEMLKFSCYGRSDSLNLGPGEHDEYYVNKVMKNARHPNELHDLQASRSST